MNWAQNSPELLKYLEENDLIPGSRVEVLRVLPVNQSISLNVKGHTVSLSFTIARFIFAELLD